ncbi:MAG: CHAT domain-containing protein [Pyrinomonadaceae bacterium]
MTSPREWATADTILPADVINYVLPPAHAGLAALNDAHPAFAALHAGLYAGRLLRRLKFQRRFAALTILLLCAASINLAHPHVQVAPPQDNNTAAQQSFAVGQQLLATGTAQAERQAIEKFNAAAQLWHAAGDKRHEAIALSFAGKVYDLLGEKQPALDYYTRTLALMHEVGDRASEAATLNNIGLIYDSLGEKEQALDYYNRALPLLRAGGDTRVEAITLVNIGLVHDSIGEWQQALSFYRQALPILRAARDRGGEAVTLNNIGYVYDSIGERQQALTYFGQALPILQEIGDHRVEAITLNNVGYVYDALGERQKALDYYNRALPVLRAVGDRRMEAVTLDNIGLVQASLGDTRQALDVLIRALELRRAVGDRAGEAVTLSDIGSVHAQLGATQQARSFYQQSLQLSRAVADRSTEAATLRRLALVERDRGQLTEARTHIEAALAIVEHLRTRLAGQELRAAYFASVQECFATYITLLMRLHQLDPNSGYDALALQASERARARSLLDSLTEARADIRQGVAAPLLARERALQQKLDAAAERQARLGGDQHNVEQSARLQHETETLLTQYQEVEAELRAGSPRYAALTQPVPLTLKEMQQQVVDADTLLLEYALGAEHSYLWAVTPTTIKSFELPPRAEIETATRRVYELLTARNRHIKFETPDERRTRITRADADYTTAANALSQMLLGPVAPQLERKRLLIVSDGALNYLPFAALPAPAQLRTAEFGLRNEKQQPLQSAIRHLPSAIPLIVEHEIVSLPSASTLAVLRRELAGRTPAPKTLAVVADPVFAKDDERVRGLKAGQRRVARPERAIEVRGTSGRLEAEALRSTPQADADETTRIERLPFTRREAAEILSLVPAAERLEALDFDASRAIATSPALSQYRYVHFATHGFLNAMHPELSGIVLSLVNRQGAEQDGFLWAHEVYNLHLPAELVVLSGCRTGLGKEIKGEGLVGLTRGFMYAGSARVLVSLWDISDEASAELMAGFYQAMLKDHKQPAAALRAAQLAILNEQRWQAPYYWAAFILQGEPR